jgi:hypothetical protein
VSATIVGGEPISKGPEFGFEVAALVQKLLEKLVEKPSLALHSNHR